MNKILFSSSKDNWHTPKDLYNKLNKEYNFVLDPCSDYNNLNCPNYFTINENGLNQDWFKYNGWVFVNPPYSQIKKWCIKCFNEYIQHKTKIVLLIPARTDTSYFHDYIYHVCNIEFLRGRLHFSESKNSAPFPSMLCIFN